MAATVTLPDLAPIATTGIWVPDAGALAPIGLELQALEPRRILGFRLDEVPRLPRETPIEAPELKGGRVRAWYVDGTDETDPELRCVVVRLDRERDAQLAGSGDDC